MVQAQEKPMRVVPSDESERSGRNLVSMAAVFKHGIKIIRNVKCLTERS